jgi:DeoR/GlpR family transcriptional regulator of sugar metabolism
MKQRMLASGRRRVVVTDGSTLGVTSVALICPVDDVDLVISGPSAPAVVVEQLTALDLELDIVDDPAAPPTAPSESTPA